MSRDAQTPVDLVRWTFAVAPDRRNEIESHLHDLGADVLVRGGEHLVVTWEEPEGEMEELVEALWEMNGGPFEVTVEQFQRIALHTLESDDAGVQEAA